MGDPWRLVEPCCGSAAFTLHMLGWRKSLLPYQGTKWKFRRELEAIAAELGFTGRPTSVGLYDVGPMENAVRCALVDDLRAEVVACLHDMAAEDPRVVYDRLRRTSLPATGTLTAAATLFLQRLSFSGKAVGYRDGYLTSPGFNKSSAYGTEATGRFGRVRPQVPSLIRNLVAAPSTPGVLDRRGGQVLVYIDPPYAGTTKYPNGTMSRAEVARKARASLRAGRGVMVSEAEPIHQLVAEGWRTRQVAGPGNGEAPFRSKQPEWVTYNGPDLG